MRPTAACLAARESSAPELIFPIPTGPKRSTPAARPQSRRSFDVLHLLAEFFDFRFDFESQSGDSEGFAFYSGSFGKQGVGLAMHLLQKEIQFLAQLTRSVQQLR